MRLRHCLFAVIAAFVLLLGGMTAADASPTATPATAYKCGSQCNGHAPSWVIPSNGIQCSKSAELIGRGHPAFGMTSPVDPDITVKAYYSTVCQTMWATVTTAEWSSTTSCGYIVYRTASPTYQHTASCLDKPTTTVMIDDANGGSVAGWVEVTTQWYASNGDFDGGYWKKSY